MFDSGFGGLTVARALIDLLPDEDLVYFGDTGRYPYGPRPLEEVRGFARQITHLLIERHNVKMVVVACNNASAAALDALRFEHDVPIVGVIDPGVRALLSATRNRRVGVIATVGTVASGAYQRAVAASRASVPRRTDSWSGSSSNRPSRAVIIPAMSDSTGPETIDGIRVVPLRRIPDERGTILHMLRRTDEHFVEFGEIYFTTIYRGVVKGWHRHRLMTLNYACISGRIKLVLYDDRPDSPTGQW